MHIVVSSKFPSESSQGGFVILSNLKKKTSLRFQTTPRSNTTTAATFACLTIIKSTFARVLFHLLNISQPFSPKQRREMTYWAVVKTNN